MSDWSLYDRGFSLFPLDAHSKSPAVEWRYYQTARAAPTQISHWSKTTSNTGVATGAVSGVIVLDADSLMSRVAADALGIPDTLTVATPRGWHFYFQHPGWDVPNKAGRTWTGVHAVDGWDIRGDGGYVVGPGSYYVPTADELAKGKVEGAYSIERDAPIAPAPDWLLELLFPKPVKPASPPKVADETTGYGRAALNREVAILTSAHTGEVNNQINLSAFAIGQLVGGGEITGEEGWAALWEALEALGVADDGKAPGTLQRGWEAGMAEPRSVEHVEPLTPEQALGTRHAASAEPEQPPVDHTRMTVAFSRGKRIHAHEMPVLFQNCWFVERQETIYVKGRGLLKATAFDTLFGGFEYPKDLAGTAKTQSAWAAFRMSPDWSCPIVYDICFRPDRAPGAVISVEGRPFINTYEPITTKRVVGDPGPFLGLLRKLFPIERDFRIITAYMCAVVQNPGRKFQWWPVVQGVQGNGKTLLLSAIEYAIGKRYSHRIDPEVLGKTANQFNSWIQGNLFVGIEEIFIHEQRHILETFKPIVTNSRTRVEGKGRDATTGDNFCNGIMLTNYRNGVPINEDERRYAVFFSAQQEVADLARDGMDGAYFTDLHDWCNGRGAWAAHGEDYGFAVVNEWLQTAVPDVQYNPAGACQRAPETSSTADAINESLGPLEQEVREAIDGDEHGFRGGLVTSTALRNLFDRRRKNCSPRAFKAVMKALGYYPHPILFGQKGRLNNPFADGSKPVLYFKRGSHFLAISETADLKVAAELTLNGIEASDNVVILRPPIPSAR